MNKKFNFVYEVTNLINNKKYIGKHSTNKMNDGYMGSGVVIKRAIEKYGLENFRLDILKNFETSQEAYDYEASLITEDVVSSDEYYNLKPGGKGGGALHTDESKAKMRASSKKRFENTSGTVAGKTAYNNGKENIFVLEGEQPEGFVKGMVMPNRKSRKGCVVKPTTTGTYWANNGLINKLIQPGVLLPEGFIKGRLIKRDQTGKFA